MLSLRIQHLLASFRKIACIAGYLHIERRRNDLVISLALQPLQLRHSCTTRVVEVLSLRMQHLLASFRKIDIACYLHRSGNGLTASLSLQSLQLRQGPVSPFFVSGSIALYEVELFGSKQ